MLRSVFTRRRLYRSFLVQVSNTLTRPAAARMAAWHVVRLLRLALLRGEARQRLGDLRQRAERLELLHQGVHLVGRRWRIRKTGVAHVNAAVVLWSGAEEEIE